jgi:hypothetical protein
MVRRRSGRDRCSAAPPPHDRIYSSHSANQMTEDQLDGVPRDRGRRYSDKDSCFQLPRLLTSATAVRTRTASLSRASCINKKTARPKLQTLHPSPSHNILKPESNADPFPKSSYDQGPGQRAPPPAPPPQRSVSAAWWQHQPLLVVANYCTLPSSTRSLSSPSFIRNYSTEQSRLPVG